MQLVKTCSYHRYGSFYQLHFYSRSEKSVNPLIHLKSLIKVIVCIRMLFSGLKK